MYKLLVSLVQIVLVCYYFVLSHLYLKQSKIYRLVVKYTVAQLLATTLDEMIPYPLV